MARAHTNDKANQPPSSYNQTKKNLRYKRSAYIAAKHIFDKNTEVVLLCTQQLQKELMSNDHILIGIAINCLSIVLSLVTILWIILSR